MAIEPKSYGACLVRVDMGQGAGIESLGYTANGGQVRFNPFTLDVPSDREGGDAGAPRDVQYLNCSATINLELTEWEDSVGDKLKAWVPGATNGTFADSAVGTLARTASAKTFRLILATTSEPRNFPTCIIRDSWEINRGTRHSRLILAITAYRWSSGVLYNTTTS